MLNELSQAVKRLQKANEHAKQWRQDMALIPNRVAGVGKATWDVEFYDRNGVKQNRSAKGYRVLQPMAKTEAIKSKRIIKENKRPFHKPVKQKQATRATGESERWSRQLAIFHSKEIA